VREAAGARFDQVELSACFVHIVVTGLRRAAADRLTGAGGQTAGLSAEQLLASPFVLIGSVDATVEQLLALRERYGVSRVWVYPRDAVASAPVVARLAGAWPPVLPLHLPPEDAHLVPQRQELDRLRPSGRRPDQGQAEQPAGDGVDNGEVPRGRAYLAGAPSQRGFCTQQARRCGLIRERSALAAMCRCRAPSRKRWDGAPGGAGPRARPWPYAGRSAAGRDYKRAGA
jgi:hypothetical protein